MKSPPAALLPLDEIPTEGVLLGAPAIPLGNHPGFAGSPLPLGQVPARGAPLNDAGGKPHTRERLKRKARKLVLKKGILKLLFGKAVMDALDPAIEAATGGATKAAGNVPTAAVPV